MIKKLGSAMKKMAQRSMMRGNRGDAQAIEEHGMMGMRSNLQGQPQNSITQHVGGTTGVHQVAAQEAAKAVTNHGGVTQTQPVHKNVGSSVLGALGTDEQ